MATEDEIRELKRRHAARLLRQPGVSGVGVERGEDGGFVLAVHLDRDAAFAPGELPERIEGHPVRYLRSGPFRKMEGEG
jgi:predicted sugar kinase